MYVRTSACDEFNSAMQTASSCARVTPKHARVCVRTSACAFLMGGEKGHGGLDTRTYVHVQWRSYH